MTKWGMVIDLDKCTGCQACSTACQMENNRLPGENYQDVLYYTDRSQPTPKLVWFPRPCMHCEEPSCMHVCPTKATFKTEEGVVLVDWNKCIGCKYCMIACPYGVRFYTDEKPVIEPNVKDVFPGTGDLSWNPPYKGPQQDNAHGVGIQPHGVVSKCTFCYHKISKAPKGTSDLSNEDPALREYVPACVRTCAPTARYFGDLDNPNSEVSRLISDRDGARLLEHTGNKPQVYYLGRSAVVPGFKKS
jgi:molybdopterin-containing oxidoreductase family iron-sulfur binding subunit